MIISWILFSFTLCLLIVSCYYNYKFAKIIMGFEDSISESLDRLDERYTSISKILEIPLFYDSPQIRQVVNDIKECRDSILITANTLANVEDQIDGSKKA